MSKNFNYCAFYVAEPFNESALGANATKDFQYYNLLKAWKAADNTFPFNNSHETTYNVRDHSDWEATLKPRLRERLRNSHNIILFLSDHTKYSTALKEEIDYGINNLNLPVIVSYPDLKSKDDLLTIGKTKFNTFVTSLWNKLPVFRDSKSKVPVLHIPFNKETIQMALESTDFIIGSKANCTDHYYK